jgi:hypothetical protein
VSPTALRPVKLRLDGAATREEMKPPAERLGAFCLGKDSFGLRKVIEGVLKRVRSKVDLETIQDVEIELTSRLRELPFVVWNQAFIYGVHLLGRHFQISWKFS